MTEGKGHVIDPDGKARRALHEAVAEHGPAVLSNAVVMDGICQARLGDLPGEAILIGSAARTDVPALLRDLIPKLGNYGAIQSAATRLAEAHGLDMAASVWVVREFARALGLIAGGTQPAGRVPPSRGQAPPPVPAGPLGAGGPRPPAVAGPVPGRAASSNDPAGSGVSSGSGTGGSGGSAAGEAHPPVRGDPRVPGEPGGPGMLGEPGVPGGAGSTPPGRRPPGSRLFSRNTLGVAAAIAVVAAYLGVAAVAHLSPFPAQAVTVTTSPPASAPSSTIPSQSPDTAPDPSPTSDYQILLSKIPSTVQGQGNCHKAGTSIGAIAVSECVSLQGPGADSIYYYLFSDRKTLNSGFGSFLAAEKFKNQSGCTNSSSRFVDFIPQCESGFTNATPNITGYVAEYSNADNDPIIVSTDDQQQVMAVMVGTNDGDLLSYWKQMQWVAP